MVQICVYDETQDDIRERRQEYNLILRRCNEIGIVGN